MVEPVGARPVGEPVRLRRAPVAYEPLDEWAEPGDERRADDLVAYLDEVEQDLGWGPRPGEHLALDLDVVVDGDPLRGHELDAYLFALIDRLGPVRFDAAFARKHARTAARSSLTVGPTGTPHHPGPPRADIRVTAPATSIDWKEELHAAVQAVTPSPAPAGPVALAIRFTLSRRRNWTALWRPALDALGPILGVGDPTRPYRARDDRITALDLHRRLDDSIGHGVRLEIWWEPAEYAAQPSVQNHPETLA
jgi:hypothetical protein